MDKFFLLEALKEAEKGLELDEVPVGAVIVVDNVIIARAHNEKQTLKIATKHAEIVAIEKASQCLNSWQLQNATIYVTLEPCMMCLGAIIHARIKRIVFGAIDKKAGALGGKFDLRLNHNHLVEVDYFKLEECSTILTNYFKQKRNGGKHGL